MGLIIGLGLLGLLLGKVTGMVIGVLLGIGIRWFLLNTIRGGLQQSQSTFLDVTFAVMGCLSKADGVVTRDEIQAAQRIFDMLRLSEQQKVHAREAFNRGKAADFDLDAELNRLRSIAGFGRGPLLRLFLQLQCMAIAADGVIDPAEHRMLVRIASRLGLTERDVAQLEALLRASTAGPGAGYAGGGAGAPPPRSRLKDAYTALGLTEDASDTEIKRAYRKLVSENHPDKLATRGLPDSVREVAEERIREINVAYDLIKEARGFK